MWPLRSIEDHASTISVLHAELNDLRRLLENERAAFADERKQLLDRIMALSQPLALREMQPRERQAVVEKPRVAGRINFPGYEPNQRPPHPLDAAEADRSEAS